MSSNSLYIIILIFTNQVIFTSEKTIILEKSETVINFNSDIYINNPFSPNTYRFIYDISIFDSISFHSSILFFIILTLFLIFLIIHKICKSCHHINESIIYQVEREFTFRERFSWTFLISKLKFIRTQTNMNIHQSEILVDDDSIQRFNENIFYGADWKIEDDMITSLTNEKILINSYFNKMREVFNIDEEKLSVLSYDMYCDFSHKKKKRDNENTLKNSILLKSISDSLDFNTNSNMNNQFEPCNNTQKNTSNTKTKTIMSLSSNNSNRSSRFSNDTSSSLDKNIVITPITFRSFKQMLTIVVGNSITIVSLFSLDNKILNHSDMILFFFFKFTFCIYMSTLISPCNIPHSSDASFYDYSFKYILSLSNIINSILCILFFIPIGFLTIKLLKKQSIGNISEENFALKKRNYNYKHFIGYILIYIIFSLGLFNSIWICLLNNETNVINTFFFDMIIIFIFEIIISPLVELGFKVIVYLLIFQNSNIGIFKKGLILLTFFFYW